MERIKKQTNNDFERVGENKAYKSLEQWISTCCHGSKHNHFSFTITHDIEEDMEIDKPCFDPIETTLIVMECCLHEKSTPPSIPIIMPSSSVGVGGLRLWALTKKPKS